MTIPDGFVLIETPHTREAAHAALAAVRAAGLNPKLVKAVQAGYLIPAGAEDKYVTEDLVADEPVTETQDESDSGPDDSWKNADIEAYAAENGYDLGGATKKADMLAALAAAQKES